MNLWFYFIGVSSVKVVKNSFLENDSIKWFVFIVWRDMTWPELLKELVSVDVGCKQAKGAMQTLISILIKKSNANSHSLRSKHHIL